MEPLWIEVGGLTIRAPVNAGTNLVLAIQCLVYYRHLRQGPGDRSRFWALFFAGMAVATLAGVAKHGLRHLMSPHWLLIVLWTSNLGSGVSTYFAQRATIASSPHHGRSRLERLVLAQLGVFLATNLAFGPEITLLIANTVLGLVPVIVIEARRALGGHACGGWVASGLAVSILTGAVYILGLSLGPGFNHIDIAHALMGVSFYLILQGGAGGQPADPIRQLGTRAYVLTDAALRQAYEGSQEPLSDNVRLSDSDGRRPNLSSSRGGEFSWT